MPFSEEIISKTFSYFVGVETDPDCVYCYKHDEIGDFYDPPEWFEDEPEICGYELSVKSSKIFKNPDRYPEIYKAFMDDEFKPRYEFLEAKTYLRKLKKGRGKSRSALLESRKKRF